MVWGVWSRGSGLGDVCLVQGEGGLVWGVSGPEGGVWSRGVSDPKRGYLVRYPPVDRQMPVNLLPCPKLRLRVVKIQKCRIFCSFLNRFKLFCL